MVTGVLTWGEGCGDRSSHLGGRGVVTAVLIWEGGVWWPEFSSGREGW